MAENALARHYSRFRVAERLLLTGHSHQAWPDVGFEAQQQAWLDAASLVDDKWDRAAMQAEHVREGFARLLGDAPKNIALGVNTHELVTRWLSALPLAKRPRLVTTDAEFHTIHRQTTRLAEEGFEVARISARPVDTLAERLAASVDSRTACVMVSSVLFDTAEIVPHLDRVATTCRQHGAQLLVDAYHHLNVVPFDIQSMGLAGAFVTGGGYKYCQLGEGNCFLRVPDGSRMRPVLTGWFAAFDALEERRAGSVTYGEGGAAFAGATYDPTSNYRGAAVFAFHGAQGMTADVLHAINVRQVTMLKASVEALDLSPSIARVEALPADRRGGFLAVRAANARQFAHQLRERGVYVDARGDILRFGPAPYLRDDQLTDAIEAFRDIVRS